MLSLDINAILLVVIPLCATGIGYLVDRAYKRSDARKTEMLELIKKQRDEAEEEKDEALRKMREAEDLALAYWQLLVKNGIEPVPPLTGRRG